MRLAAGDDGRGGLVAGRFDAEDQAAGRWWLGIGAHAALAMIWATMYRNTSGERDLLRGVRAACRLQREIGAFVASPIDSALHRTVSCGVFDKICGEL